MKKLLPILIITLTSLLITKEVWSLPNCPSAASVWNNCFGTHIFTDDGYSGDKYVGEWRDDNRHGWGTYYFLADNEFKGDKYEGDHVNGSYNGKGTYTWANGDKYIGNFKDGYRHGQGAYFYGDGGVQEGIWKDDEFQYENIIPRNAYAFGSSWKCNSGYKKSGNSCIKNIYIPPNAFASGSSWKCNSGYTKSGNNCIENPVDTQVYSAASGSGFAVTSDGYVITNYHVIKGCTDVYIHDKGESILSTIVTFDPNNDIALLKGKFKPRSFYPLSRESTKLLTEVYVAGHPFGRDISTSVKVTRGIVSSLTGIANNFSNLQIDASLQPGSSGGPIMNDKGNVIGVAVAKLDLDTIVEDYGVVPENVNFGVKANVVIHIMESENIKLPKPNLKAIPMSELSEIITDGTYYLSCWMTMAQINKMKETKVIFKSFN